MGFIIYNTPFLISRVKADSPVVSQFTEQGQKLAVSAPDFKEILAVQILSPTEIDPDVTGDLRLVDCETDQLLDVSSAADLITIYHEHRLAFEDQLAQLCAQRRGRFMSISSEDEFEWNLIQDDPNDVLIEVEYTPTGEDYPDKVELEDIPGLVQCLRLNMEKLRDLGKPAATTPTTTAAASTATSSGKASSTNRSSDSLARCVWVSRMVSIGTAVNSSM